MLGVTLLLIGVGAASAQPPAASACPPEPSLLTAEQAQAVRQSARDRGALWRITRDGRTSYLYGTIHVGRREWVVLGPQVRDALRASDTLALEIDLTDPELLARLTTPQVRPLALPGTLEQRIAGRMQAVCVPPEGRAALRAMHPILQTATLSVMEGRWEGLHTEYGQDLVLAAFAHALQRRIVSLETPELQLDAMIPTTDAAAIKAVHNAVEQLEQGKARRAISLLAAAWERGDMDTLAAYERWCECVLDDDDRKTMTRLLDDRHPGLADRIDALHRRGARVFAGVGALHMVGPSALPILMRARGFEVERVPFP